MVVWLNDQLKDQVCTFHLDYKYVRLKDHLRTTALLPSCASLFLDYATQFVSFSRDHLINLPGLKRPTSHTVTKEATFQTNRVTQDQSY